MILESNPFEEPKRSQFLTVLCILSFIMCGLGLLSGIWGIYQSTPEAMQKNVEQVRAVNEEMADQMEDQMIEMQSNPFSKVAPYLGLVYTLASFLGVLLMWNRTKKGFYIYAIAANFTLHQYYINGEEFIKYDGTSRWQWRYFCHGWHCTNGGN
jgi:hypothetical protein